jgi:hypothetical protein
VESSSWTSLEIAKLVVSMLSPLAVVGIGYLITRATKRLESVQWANQTVIQRRLEIFSEVAPKLNRLLCFALFVGAWKETMPSDAVRLKREIDETIYVNRVLFSPQLFDAYSHYMQTLFHMYARTDSDAPIRAEIVTTLGDRRKLPWWETSMESCFASGQIPSQAEILAAYDALGEKFRRDLYVTRHELSLA